MIEKNIPLVSICCITYNHENFIRDAIEGFLMQKTTFPVEIIIHDDASTDGTASIIREYVQKHTDLIYPIYQKKNQYSKGIKPLMHYAIPKARGKYVALCDGDDYWTDPSKLQKQIDFLEKYPEYGFNCHDFMIQRNGILLPTESQMSLHEFTNGLEIDKEIFFNNWVTKSLTMVIKRELLFLNYRKYQVFNDYTLFYNIINKQKGYWLNFIGGVYCEHSNGVFSSLNDFSKLIYRYKLFASLFKNHPNEYYFKLTLFNINRSILEFLFKSRKNLLKNGWITILFSFRLLRISEKKLGTLYFIRNSFIKLISA